MLPPQEFFNFFGPVLHGAFEKGWILKNGGDTYDWRARTPPFAMVADSAVKELTAEHYAWFRAQSTFPRLLEGEEMEYRFTGATFKRDGLYLYQLHPETMTGRLYHATPAKRVKEIETSGGLKPGRLTNVSTTRFRDSAHWIHVCVSEEDQRNWILKEKLLAERSGEKDWVIFRIEHTATDGVMFADPASDTGYVLPDELVPWTAMREIDRVQLP